MSSPRLIALITAFIILAGLAFYCLKNGPDAEGKKLTSSEIDLLIETSLFDYNEDGDGVIALFDEKEGLSSEELGNGEKASAKLNAAYNKFQGESKSISPIITLGVFVAAGIVLALIIVLHILPAFAQKASEEIFGSSEEVDHDDPNIKAQSLTLQGDWEGAIEQFKLASEQDPANRLPLIEIAQIQRERLDQPKEALQTLTEAIARGGWRENDEAFFMFRQADIYHEDLEDNGKAVSVLREIIAKYPQTRHSANANHKLHEFGAE